MADENEFIDIQPFTDEEAVKALGELADLPETKEISQVMFPNEADTYLSDFLKNVKSIDDFQTNVMSKFVELVLDRTCHNFSYDGIENIKKVDGRALFLSNHRDIILDPAITQVVLWKNHLPITEIAVGSNLLTNKVIEALIRSNRMIKVIRGISARKMYLSSQILTTFLPASFHPLFRKEMVGSGRERRDGMGAKRCVPLREWILFRIFAIQNCSEYELFESR